LVIIVLSVDSSQKAPGLHILGGPLHLSFQRQHGFTEQPTLEQRPSLGKAVGILVPNQAMSLNRSLDSQLRNPHRSLLCETVCICQAKQLLRSVVLLVCDV